MSITNRGVTKLKLKTSHNPIIHFSALIKAEYTVKFTAVFNHIKVLLEVGL